MACLPYRCNAFVIKKVPETLQIRNAREEISELVFLVGDEDEAVLGSFGSLSKHSLFFFLNRKYYVPENISQVLAKLFSTSTCIHSFFQIIICVTKNSIRHFYPYKYNITLAFLEAVLRYKQDYNSLIMSLELQSNPI